MSLNSNHISVFCLAARSKETCKWRAVFSHWFKIRTWSSIPVHWLQRWVPRHPGQYNYSSTLRQWSGLLRRWKTIELDQDPKRSQTRTKNQARQQCKKTQQSQKSQIPRQLLPTIHKTLRDMEERHLSRRGSHAHLRRWVTRWEDAQDQNQTTLWYR